VGGRDGESRGWALDAVEWMKTCCSNKERKEERMKGWMPRGCFQAGKQTAEDVIIRNVTGFKRCPKPEPGGKKTGCVPS
jgi:hypothetical protein